MSERRKGAHWLQNILRDSKISFQVNNQTFNGHGRVIENVVEENSILRVSELMDKKYGWSDGLVVELYTSWFQKKKEN